MIKILRIVFFYAFCLILLFSIGLTFTPKMSNASTNATGELTSRADNILGLASDAASNATQAAMNNTMNMLSNVSTSVADAISNATTNKPEQQYKNYTSQKYQIQFEYPSTWMLEEKTNRFDEGLDISITSAGGAGLDVIAIGYTEDLIGGYGTTDLRSAVTDFLNGMSSDYTKEFRTIESPSFVTIDGHNSGTFLFTAKEKYETSPYTAATQVWITFLDGRGYVFTFLSSPTNFDSPENTEIRDHLIKSVKFLGVNDQISANSTNRFG